MTAMDSSHRHARVMARLQALVAAFQRHKGCVNVSLPSNHIVHLNQPFTRTSPQRKMSGTVYAGFKARCRLCQDVYWYSQDSLSVNEFLDARRGNNDHFRAQEVFEHDDEDYVYQIRTQSSTAGEWTALCYHCLLVRGWEDREQLRMYGFGPERKRVPRMRSRLPPEDPPGDWKLSTIKRVIRERDFQETTIKEDLREAAWPADETRLLIQVQAWVLGLLDPNGVRGSPARFPKPKIASSTEQLPFTDNIEREREHSYQEVLGKWILREGLPELVDPGLRSYSRRAVSSINAADRDDEDLRELSHVQSAEQSADDDNDESSTSEESSVNSAQSGFHESSLMRDQLSEHGQRIPANRLLPTTSLSRREDHIRSRAPVLRDEYGSQQRPMLRINTKVPPGVTVTGESGLGKSSIDFFEHTEPAPVLRTHSMWRRHINGSNSPTVQRNTQCPRSRNGRDSKLLHVQRPSAAPPRRTLAEAEWRTEGSSRQRMESVMEKFSRYRRDSSSTIPEHHRDEGV